MTLIKDTLLNCCHLFNRCSERAIFALLLDAAKANNGRTVIRIAGGWVRDKLLGRDSDDIDVALDNVSGNTFAKVSSAFHISDIDIIGVFVSCAQCLLNREQQKQACHKQASSGVDSSSR
jgi:Poly A polymerase head domain